MSAGRAPRAPVVRPEAQSAALFPAERELTAEDYELFRRLVYEQCGINLGPQKQQLVRARLGKRLRSGGFRSYREYYEYVRQDATGTEIGALIDAISTNTTHLFRERQHFDFLTGVLREWLGSASWRRTNAPVRLWSAGCSTGDEPYSIAMTLEDLLNGEVEWRLLATDISSRVLAAARVGRYDAHRLGTVPPLFRQRFFRPDPDGARGGLEIRSELRQRITFARLNLVTDPFPFRHGFHFIFCRNVMIYFDRPTQQQVVNKFAAQLRPGGYLLIGHSESLNALQQPLRYVRPTVYRKDPA